jgi:hypothetical protein
MHVAIKDGGDGVPCWNRAAVMAHADAANRREQQVAERNPDVVVLPGRLVCYGCEVMEYDYGIKCTARLTRTRYLVEGELAPRPEDAEASLSEIPGLLTRAPDDVKPETPAEPVAQPPVQAPGRSRFRLFGGGSSA